MIVWKTLENKMQVLLETYNQPQQIPAHPLHTQYFKKLKYARRVTHCVMYGQTMIPVRNIH